MGSGLELRQFFFDLSRVAVVGIDLQHLLQLLPSELWLIGFLVREAEVIVNVSIVGQFIFHPQTASCSKLIAVLQWATESNQGRAIA
jgi:hypothetical protein